MEVCVWGGGGGGGGDWSLEWVEVDKNLQDFIYLRKLPEVRISMGRMYLCPVVSFRMYLPPALEVYNSPVVEVRLGDGYLVAEWIHTAITAQVEIVTIWGKIGGGGVLQTWNKLVSLFYR